MSGQPPTDDLPAPDFFSSSAPKMPTFLFLVGLKHVREALYLRGTSPAFFSLNSMLLVILLCVDTYMPRCIGGGQRSAFRSRSCSSTCGSQQLVSHAFTLSPEPA